MHNEYKYFFGVKKLLLCSLKMEGVGNYVTTIHDKNANNFKLSHDRPIPLYISSFKFMINKQKYFPSLEFCLTAE